MNEPVAVGLVGVSGFARVHYQELLAAHAAGTVRLVGAAIINQDEEAEKCDRLRELGCRLRDDFAGLLLDAAELDLVVVPTGIHLHEPMTVAALEAGCDVLVEKPAAADTASVERMLAAEARAGRRVAVAFQHIYRDTTAEVEAVLRAGTIGTLRSVHVLGLWPRSDRYYGRNAWAGRRVVDGVRVNDAPFHNAFAHYVNLALRFAGPLDHRNARPLAAEAHLWRARDIESCDTASFTLTVEAGPAIHVHLTHSCATNQSPRISLVGDAGAITWATYGAPLLARADGTREVIGDPAATDRRQVWEHVPRWVRGDPAARCSSLAMAAEQVRASDLVFAHPVRDVPVDRIDVRPDAEKPEELVPVITGIDGIFERAWSERRALTSEERAAIG